MLLSTDLFTFKNGVFSAEASSLELGVGWSPPARITLQNPKTGGLCAFQRYLTVTDEGDVVEWRYGDAEEVQRGYPITLAIFIYND